MKKAVALLTLALSACGGGSEQAATPATPPVATAQNLGPVVFVGDSITAGWPLQATITNAGIPGNRSADMLARFDDLLAKRPTTVVILAGTNDVRYSLDANTNAVARMGELAAHSGACVVLGTIPPVADWLEDTQFTIEEGTARVARWNQELRMLASAYGYRIADFHAVLIGSDGWMDHALFQDTVHPNALGYRKMWPVVEPLLSCTHS